MVSAIEEAGGEPEEGTLARFLYDLGEYQIRRTKTELLFFVSLQEAMKIMRNPAASLSVIEKTVKGFTSMMPHLTSDGIVWQTYEKGDKKGRWKGDKMLDIVPIWAQIRGMKHMEEKINYMKTY